MLLHLALCLAADSDSVVVTASNVSAMSNRDRQHPLGTRLTVHLNINTILCIIMVIVFLIVIIRVFFDKHSHMIFFAIKINTITTRLAREETNLKRALDAIEQYTHVYMTERNIMTNIIEDPDLSKIVTELRNG